MFLRLIFLSFLVFSSIVTTPILLTTAAWADEGGDGDGGDSGGDGGDSGGGQGDSGNGGTSGGGTGGTGVNQDNRFKRSSASGKFKSLSSVIRKFKNSKRGRFLEANITRRKGVYYYKITYINSRGKVRREFFPARKSTNRRGTGRSRQNFNKSKN